MGKEERRGEAAALMGGGQQPGSLPPSGWDAPSPSLINEQLAFREVQAPGGHRADAGPRARHPNMPVSSLP